MKVKRLWMMMGCLILGYGLAFGQSEGEKLFKQVCVACHTIGQGKLIGPDLANVHTRRPMEWILRFVKSSQSVIRSGDPYAMALFEEYNRMVMPDNNFTDDQIRAIIAYIAENSPGGPGEAATGGVALPAGKPLSEATPGDVEQGRNLFQGTRRMSHGGPACNSCHNVHYSQVMAGGALAKDLTDAYSRLGEAGIKALLGSPPFPAMKQAYSGRPLTDEEIFALTAFLARVDQQKTAQPPKNYAFTLFAYGLGGALVLLVVFGGLWTRNKQSSVNEKIYQRQIRSL